MSTRTYDELFAEARADGLDVSRLIRRFVQMGLAARRARRAAAVTSPTVG